MQNNLKNNNIFLSDNNRYQPNVKQEDGDIDNIFVNTYKSTQVNLLVSKFDGVRISELCGSYSSLLSFPGDVLGGEDDSVLFDACELSDENYYRLKTDNLMGFVGVTDDKGRSQILNVGSRFAAKEKQDYFLNYLLTKVFHFNLFKNLDYASDPKTQAFDWLMMMFPHYLKKAYAQGIFRAYKTYRHNDANVCGVIDVSRHISNNIPFQGRIAYNTREYTRDNPVMQLVRHTIECLDRHKTGRDILQIDRETKEAVEVVRQYTNYVPNDLLLVVSQNKPIVHPYYTAYSELQNLCLRILRHERIGYGEDKNYTVSGILFDGAWLWEEYLYSILRHCGYKHPQNKERIGGIELFDESSPKKHRIYPDFYNNTSKIVLDAKYKKFDERFRREKWDPGIREDVFQIITYMHIQGYKVGGFIYPCQDDESQRGDYPLTIDSNIIHTIPFHVPKISGTCTWNDFCIMMHDEEDRLKNTIGDL